jgi:PPOX class probable F420-dependent enzyme
MAERIDGRARELLEKPNFAAVATLREDGTPAVNVTWVDLDNGHVVLNSAEGRKWPDNLRREGRVTITVVNHDNPYEYVQIRGRLAEEDHDQADENIDALAKKYLDKDEYPFRQPGEKRVMFRIEPEKVAHQGG